MKQNINNYINISYGLKCFLFKLHQITYFITQFIIQDCSYNTDRNSIKILVYMRTYINKTPYRGYSYKYVYAYYTCMFGIAKQDTMSLINGNNL